VPPPPPFAAPGEVVYGLDNVPLELPLARVGSRVLAAFLDYLLFAAVAVAWVLAALAVAAVADVGGGWAAAVVVLGLFLLEYGFFVGQEVAFGGQTLGKRAFSLRVVAADGSAAGTAALVVRNLVRVIDVLVGVPVMALDPLARRLGDRLGGTLVVHHRPRQPEVMLRRLPAGWGAEEARLVEAFLLRAGQLAAGDRALLAGRLARWVDRERPGFLPPGREAEVRLAAGFAAELV
jgi:uncharacterized RDD family membrane protein YckC